MTTIPFPIPIPSPDSPRRRGAPPGNRNARKKESSDRQDVVWEIVRALSETKGCAEEIAMLRIRIKAMFARNVPDDEIIHACDVLNRLLQTHHKIMLAEGDTN